MSKKGPMRGLKILPLRLKVRRNSDCDGKWAFFAFWAYFERDNYKIRNSEVAYVHYSSSQWQGEGWEVHRWPIWNMYLLPWGLKVGRNSNCDKKWAFIAFWAYLEIDNYELANSEVAYPHYFSSQWPGGGWEAHRWPIRSIILLPWGLKIGQNTICERNWAFLAP